MKTPKTIKITHVIRNWVAVAATQRGGAGFHKHKTAGRGGSTNSQRDFMGEYEDSMEDREFLVASEDYAGLENDDVDLEDQEHFDYENACDD